MSGTPKTLREAIRNGLESNDNRPWDGSQEAVVEKHVLDFLRQKFGVVWLNHGPTEDLEWLAKQIGVTV